MLKYSDDFEDFKIYEMKDVRSNELCLSLKLKQIRNMRYHTMS